MKKILFIATIIIMASTAFAQERNIYLGISGIQVGGSGPILGTGVFYHKYNEDSETTFGLAPEIGYFISDKFAIGMSIGFNYSIAKYEDWNADISDYERKSENATGWGIGTYVRYYAIKTERFGLYLQGGLSFISTKYEYNTKAENFFYAGIKPCVSYNISDRFTIHAAFGDLGYYDYNSTTTYFRLSLDAATLLFGLTIAL